MNTVKLDGRQRSKQAIVRKLARDLKFPEHFSSNLDALYDTLTTDIKGPITIVWHSTAAARHRIGPDYKRIVTVLEEAEKARKRSDDTIDLAFVCHLEEATWFAKTILWLRQQSDPI